MPGQQQHQKGEGVDLPSAQGLEARTGIKRYGQPSTLPLRDSCSCCRGCRLALEGLRLPLPRDTEVNEAHVLGLGPLSSTYMGMT
jgi:hypothetical protein